MSFEHPYPDFAYLEIDPETNEKRWYGTKGMGVRYVHEDRAAEDVERLRHPFRNADALDWEHLFKMLPDSGHGQFWKAALTEAKAALAAKQ